MADYENIFLGNHGASFQDNFNETEAVHPKRTFSLPSADTTVTTTTVTVDATQNVFRGVLGGVYVFSIGSPPAGATDVVVVGTVEVT